MQGVLAATGSNSPLVTLLKLLSISEHELRVTVLRCLTVLCQYNPINQRKVIVYIYDSDGLQDLLRLVSPRAHGSAAAVTVASLALGSDTMAAELLAASKGLITRLVRMLDSKHPPQMQFAACAALAALCEHNEEAQSKCVEEGALPILVELLRGDTTTATKSAAATALCLIVRGRNKLRREICKVDGIAIVLADAVARGQQLRLRTSAGELALELLREGSRAPQDLVDLLLPHCGEILIAAPKATASASESSSPKGEMVRVEETHTPLARHWLLVLPDGSVEGEEPEFNELLVAALSCVALICASKKGRKRVLVEIDGKQLDHLVGHPDSAVREAATAAQQGMAGRKVSI
jgi:type IV secretory pathway VirB2 component (pilin)